MTNTDSDTGPYTCEGLLVIILIARVCLQNSGMQYAEECQVQHLEVKDC